MKTDKTKLPRARVNPALAVRGILIDHVKADMDTHYVCAPMPSLKSARQRAKFENLSEEQKVERLAKAICDNSRNWPGAWDKDTPESAKPGYRNDARAALAVMEGRTL